MTQEQFGTANKHSESTQWQDTHTVHFVGIGGMALSAIARILLQRGFQVSGSDSQTSSYIDDLRILGATISEGHNALNVQNADLVIYSAAIRMDNPEIIESKRLGIPIIRRSEAISALLSDKERSITVSGTHGKTTTTALISTILAKEGRNPSYLIGTKVPDLHGNARWGSGKDIVVEADEFDSAFLQYRPDVAVLTHLEADHLDYFGSPDRIEHEFCEFVSNLDSESKIITRKGIPMLDRVVQSAKAQVITYGTSGDWQLHWEGYNDGQSVFEIHPPSAPKRSVRLSLPGLHNAINAVAAIATCNNLGMEIGNCIEHLATFSGLERRFQIKSSTNGITIVDDYAHHPTEIMETIRAARELHQGRVWAVFQPHLRSRTVDLFADFLTAFNYADRVTITEIFSPQGRENTEPITGAELAKAIDHRNCDFAQTIDEASELISQEAEPGDLIVVMGAGDITNLTDKLIVWLAAV
tara:strand:+ start:3483 stop:4895 length:1413 start_codon:yes stop_codon:yes gene_type:complete